MRPVASCCGGPCCLHTPGGHGQRPPRPLGIPLRIGYDCSIILALILSSLFEYNTHIHTDSKSSMDALLKPRKRIDSVREYYPLIAAGKSLLRSTPARRCTKSQRIQNVQNTTTTAGTATSGETSLQTASPETTVSTRYPKAGTQRMCTTSGWTRAAC